MDWTSADQVALRAAMAKGVRRVTYNSGNTVEYQSLAEMMTLDQLMTASIAAAAGTARFTRAVFSRR